MSVFLPADILLPKKGFDKWAVIACDQFTSQPEYWEKAREIVGNEPSTLDLILPECYLNGSKEQIASIPKKMNEYLSAGILTEYKDAMIYTERTLPSGKVRRGVVCKIDLSEYDYVTGKGQIRATEATVLSRIPPRVEIRRNAPIELPHVLVFFADPGHKALPEGPTGEVLYDVELMLGGGRIRGSLMSGEAKKSFTDAVCGGEGGFTLAIGDGNHSLAAAKASGSRYALVELVNLFDECIVFEPIYRLAKGADFDSLAKKADEMFGHGKNKVTMLCGEKKHEFYVDSIPCGEVDRLLKEFGCEVDYIHGTESLEKLSGNGNVGFEFDGIAKEELFLYIEKNGVLPKKSFSMGTAYEKRYYMEGMKIQNI